MRGAEGALLAFVEFLRLVHPDVRSSFRRGTRADARNRKDE